jgi:RND family efflux transporter MFP subunit
MFNRLGIWSLPAILLLGGCGQHESSEEAHLSLPSVEVTTATVAEKSFTGTQALPGTVHPVDQAVIASKLMATIEEVDVAIGEQVKEGQILVRLAANEILAQVEQAEAGLAQLQRNLEREQGLLAQSATTAEAVRTLEDEIRRARAQLAEARTMESYTRISAPFSGNITAKNIRRGDLATPGSTLLTLEGLGNLEVHVEVPDSLKSQPLGAQVQLEAGDTTEKGELIEWSTAANPASRTRLAKLKLSDSTKLRSGQYVKVLWPTEQRSIFWIPEGALRIVGQLEQVFTVESETAQLQLIRTGPPIADGYQVLSGLKAGDRIILNPGTLLRDGQPITPKQ